MPMINGKVHYKSMKTAGSNYHIYWGTTQWLLDADTDPRNFLGFSLVRSQYPAKTGWQIVLLAIRDPEPLFRANRSRFIAIL